MEELSARKCRNNWDEENAERSEPDWQTSNAEYRIQGICIRHWALGVGRSAFSSFFMLSAVIVAAGSSQRMGFDKLLALLGDKPVLAHTIEAFERTASVREIILVARAERVGEFKELVRQNDFQKVRQVIAGGEQRHDSVRAGLAQVSAEATFIAVHDAARPLVTGEQIERVFELARTHGGAALAEPITNTLKRADQAGVVT